MLINLLKEIYNSPVYSKKMLANKLNTNEDMIEQGLAHLKRMGYIENYVLGGKCKFNCKSCSGNSCNLNPINSLIVTEKGEKVLATVH